MLTKKEIRGMMTRAQEFQDAGSRNLWEPYVPDAPPKPAFSDELEYDKKYG